MICVRLPDCITFVSFLGEVEGGGMEVEVNRKSCRCLKVLRAEVCEN